MILIFSILLNWASYISWSNLEMMSWRMFKGFVVSSSVKKAVNCGKLNAILETCSFGKAYQLYICSIAKYKYFHSVSS